MVPTSTSMGTITAWNTLAAETGTETNPSYFQNMSNSVSMLLNKPFVQLILLFHSVRSSISRAEAVRRHGEESCVQTRTSSGSSTMGKGSCPSSWTKTRLSSSSTTFSATHCTSGAQAKPDIPSPPPISMRNKLDWFCALDLHKTSPSYLCQRLTLSIRHEIAEIGTDHEKGSTEQEGRKASGFRHF